MKKYKYLHGSDSLLNLKKIEIGSRDAYSSLTCTGSATFYFDDTKHGCVEDPDLTGTIRVLKVEKKKGHYLLKIKFIRKRQDVIKSLHNSGDRI